MRDAAPTRARITATALRLFVEQGVAETTVEDIARAARVSQGALYTHYPSKEALAWDLFIANYTTLALRLDELQKSQPTLQAKIEAMIRHFCTFFDADRTLFAYLLLSQHGHLSRVKPSMPNPVDVLRDVIADGIRRREIPRVDANVGAAMVMGLVLQVATARIYDRIEASLTSLADTLVAATWRVLKP
jgi:AcrR family transcriptional regulator